MLCNSGKKCSKDVFLQTQSENFIDKGCIKVPFALKPVPTFILPYFY